MKPARWLWHRLLHVLGMAPCELYRWVGFDGHEWLFTSCAICGEVKPLARAGVCFCAACEKGRGE